MTGTAGSRHSQDRLHPGVWRVAAVVFVGPFMTQLDSTVVNVSLASIHQSLHSPIATAQWIISAYLLALALMLPLSGWLVDRVGAKRLYLGCFCAFTLASLLCGAARTMDELICARVLQGMAGGLLAPMTQMMIARVAGVHMARVMGYTAVPILIAPILGPVLAGVVLHYASWPWLFYFNLPIGILGVGLAAFLLPDDAAAIEVRRFDLVGLLILSPDWRAFWAASSTPPSGRELRCCWPGLFCSARLSGTRCARGSAALIDLRLFSNRMFSRAATTQFLSNATFYAGQFLVPLYLITGCAVSATRAGWMLAAMGFGMMCSFPLVGFLTERFGCRAVSAGGALLSLLGTIPFSGWSTASFRPL